MYEDEFYITAKDYQGYYTYYYEWNVDFDEIKKGVSSFGLGTAYITFIMDNGTKLESSNSVEIPKLSDEEIIAMYEEKYLSTSKEINKTIREHPFEVTLKRVGYFTHLKHDTWGDEVTHFRIDIQVKNIDDKTLSLSYREAAIVIGSEQYNVLWFDSKFDGHEIRPNVIKEGYLLFDIPEEKLHGRGYIDAGMYNPFINKDTYRFYMDFKTLTPIEGEINKITAKTSEHMVGNLRVITLTLENFSNDNISKIVLKSTKSNEKIIAVGTKSFSKSRINEREVVLIAKNSFDFGSVVKLVIVAKGKVELHVYNSQDNKLKIS